MAEEFVNSKNDQKPVSLKKSQKVKTTINTVNHGAKKTAKVLNNTKDAVKNRKYRRKLKKDLAFIENKRFKNFDKAYDQMRFQSTDEYRKFMRDMNNLFGHDMRQKMASDLQQYDASGQLVDVNSMTYQAGFYLGLLLTNKSARTYVFDMFKDQDWPPAKNKDKFLKACQDRDIKGREPFTPESAGLCLTALTEKTYKNMRNHPKQADKIMDQYKKCRQAIYDLAGQDGVDKKDIDKAQRDIIDQIVKDDPSRRFAFQGLAEGKVYDDNNELKHTNIFGKEVDLDHDIAPQMILDEDHYQDQLTHAFAEGGNEMVTCNSDKFQRAITNYYDYRNRLDKVARRQGMPRLAVKNWHEKTDSIPVDVVHASLVKQFNAQYGKSASKLIDVASQFSEKSVLANEDSLDFKRRLYNFCRDNPVDGVKLSDQVKATLETHHALQNCAKSVPLDLSHIYNAFNKSNKFQLNKKKTNEAQLNETSLDPAWLENMMAQAHVTSPRFDKGDAIQTPEMPQKLENALSKGFDKNRDQTDEANKLINSEANREHKKHTHKLLPEKTSAYKFLKLVQDLQNKHGLEGACLAIDAYDKASKHDKTDNRGQYYDIKYKDVQNVMRSVANMVKNDKYKNIGACVDAYTNSLYQEPEFADYVANGNLSPDEVADKADPAKDFGRKAHTIKNRKHLMKALKLDKSKMKVDKDHDGLDDRKESHKNYNVPKPTGREHLIKMSDRKVKPMRKTIGPSKSDAAEVKLPKIDINKENPSLARKMDNNPEKSSQPLLTKVRSL